MGKRNTNIQFSQSYFTAVTNDFLSTSMKRNLGSKLLKIHFSLLFLFHSRRVKADFKSRF